MNKKIFNAFSFRIFYLFVAINMNMSLHAQEWIELGGSQKFRFNGAIKTSYTDKAGQLYIGGYFTNDSGNYFVAKWDGKTWVELGGYNSLAANGCILSITGDNAGNIYAAGNFINANRQNYVARWNGTKWAELGGTNSLFADWNIRSICTDKDGNLYAAGGFSNGFGKQYIAKWIKSTNKWFGIRKSNGTGVPATEAIFSITALSNGNLYAGGFFSDSSGKRFVCEWNNKDSIWSSLGANKGLSANAWIEQVISDSLGNIYVAGKFTNGSDSLKGTFYVAKWDGNSWSELDGINKLNANGAINALLYDNANQRLYAAGEFSDNEVNTKGNKYVAYWDGQNWRSLNALSTLNANSTIETLTMNLQGEIFAAGWFKNKDNEYYVAKYTNQTLPLNIIDFKVQEQRKNVYSLSWQTSDETSVDEMYLQKSYDGINFVTLHKPVLKLNKVNFYNYVDVSTPTDSFTVFYRLAVQNNVGQLTYSKTISISSNFNGLVIKVMGNPILNNQLNVAFNSPVSQVLPCSIIDINGKIIFQKEFKINRGNNYITMFPNFNSSGTYYLKVLGQSKTHLLNVVK